MVVRWLSVQVKTVWTSFEVARALFSHAMAQSALYASFQIQQFSKSSKSQLEVCQNDDAEDMDYISAKLDLKK